MLDPTKTVSIPSTEFRSWYGKEALYELSQDNPNDKRPYVVRLSVPQSMSMTHGERRIMTLKFFNNKLLTRFTRIGSADQERFVQQILICMSGEYAANAEVQLQWTKAGKMRTVRVTRFGDDLSFHLKP
jgi:hypothetical protein